MATSCAASSQLPVLLATVASGGISTGIRLRTCWRAISWTISALVSALSASPRAMISSRRAMSAAEVWRSSPRMWVLIQARARSCRR